MIKNYFQLAIKLTLILLLSVSSFTSKSQNTNYFETSKNIEIFTDLYKELDMFYVDEVNAGDLIKTAIDEMLNSLDPYTTYYPESDIEDYRFMTTGQYGGIGAMITKRGDYVLISEPYEGFPAQKAGLMAGDKILEVNGKSAKGKTTEELSSILKGQPNTEVTILIERNKETFTKKFNREKVTIKSVPYYGFLEDGIAYIKLR
ncbi:MAG: S41 family peptidase, partial [Flavobacteriales bacterium]